MKIIEKYRGLSKEVKASTAYTVCNILTKCLSLITLPLFTRMMSTEEYGLSTVYASTATIVVIFTSLQLPYGSLSTAMIKFKEDRNGYLSSLCMISTTLTVIYIILCILFRNIMVQWLELPFFLILLMGVEMLFTTAQSAWMGFQRFEFQYKNVVIVTFCTAVLSTIVSLFAVIYSTQKGMAMVCSNALVTCLVGLAIFIQLLYKGRRPFEKKYWKFAFSFNVPLIPYYLSQVIFNQSDRLMINKICGRGDAAIYGVAYSLATILTFVVSAIHSSYTPWLFERIDRKEFAGSKKVTIFLSAGIAFMLLGIIALAPEIIYIMAGEKYAEAMWVVPPVAMSVLLLYYSDLFDCLLFFYEAKIFLAISAILSAGINVVLNALFISRFGFIAAAYTTLASYLILAVVDYIYMLKICRIKKISNDMYDIKSLIGIFLIFIGLGFAAMSLYEMPIIRYSIIMAVFVVLLLFRNKLMKILQNMKKD